MRQVLAITRSDDPATESVLRVLANKGARGIRFDTDRFPTETRLIVQYEESRRQLKLLTDGQEFELGDIHAIWYRRSYPGGLLPSSMQPELRRASQLEAKATLRGLIASLRCFQLDPPERVRHATNKQLQLQLAQQLGLAIPRTITTNDPEAVRRFVESSRTSVVAKMLSSFSINQIEEGRAIEKVVFTSALSAKDLEALEDLRLSPMTFQEQVAKVLELRVIVVGNRAFTASIDSQAVEGARVDWRREGARLAESWRRSELPREVEQALLRMLDFFGLNYGAFDLILTPEGRHVFLELNPAGEFLWIERSADLPICSAIADVVLGKSRRLTV